MNQARTALEILLVFLRLGCTSFGGPVAHLGYFRAEFVERRRWLTDAEYAATIAIAQSLPGPASSQVGFAIGIRRGGWLGGLAAWAGFTLPSALLMLAFASGAHLFADHTGTAVLHGLELVAVAVVAQAVLTMRRTLAPDLPHLAVAALGLVIVLFTPPAWSTPLAVAVGAICGMALRAPADRAVEPPAGSRPARPGASVALLAAFALLLTLSLSSRAQHSTAGSVLAQLYRAGALVFGGGHVVLPLLAAAVSRHAWLTQPALLAGYGAAQAVPGPLFSIGAYIGAAARPSAHPLLLGFAALIALFLPGLLLMAAVLPFWSRLRAQPWLARVLGGVNASVVGVLAAALYQPLLVTAVRALPDLLIAAAGSVALVRFRVQPWMLVIAMIALSIATARP